MVSVRCFLALFACMVAATAAAQVPPAPPPAAPAPGTPAQQRSILDLLNSTQGKIERIDANHWRLTRLVDWQPPGSMMRFFADQIDLFVDESRLEASGNVVFINPEGRLASERMEYDLDSGTGKFYQASGIMTLGAGVDRAQFGNQDPDVYFYGETIEKIGPRRYKITRGAFTTCVQPTPRWEVTSKSVTINLDDYAIARNMTLRVKGIPLLYLPVIYYPIQDDERATGILMPTYGTSTLRGASISNAFFWAIGRSHDATVFHDWFNKTGQGIGVEYRYVANLSSYGDVRAYRLAQHEATYTQDDATTTLPASTSYRVQGAMTQTLSPAVRARARVDYFTDIITQQLYQQNVYYATQPYRTIDAGLTAGVGAVSTSFQYLRSEIFSSETSSFVYGSTPRATATVAPQMLFGAPVYGSVNADYAYLPYRNITNGVIALDRTLGRVNVAPAVRIPMSRLTYLSVNTSATEKTTYYTRSQDTQGNMVPEGLVRNYLSVRSDVIGPVLTKIWDTPDSRSTERMKHVIEPAFTVDYITEIQNQANVPILSDVSDFVVGGATRFTYGVNNRLFYRSRSVDGSASQTREFVTIGVQQTYYSEPLASRYDTTYVSGSQRPNLVDLSPIAVTTRFSPNSALDANARLEYDVSGNGLQVFTTGATANFTESTPSGGGTPRTVSTTVGYSRARYRPTDEASSYLSLGTTTRLAQGRVGGQYALSWDIQRGYIQSQSAMASYMAQCCGFQVDFQLYNYPNIASIPISHDMRFNFSFVLAGLGTFSNFLGAFGVR
jgi:LPS-assembly protein